MAANANELSEESIADRLLDAVTDTFTVFSTYIGDQLGYYETIDALGPISSPELADQTATHERYAREWLEAQTAVGILVVEDPTGPPRQRRYDIPSDHAAVLVDSTDLDCLIGLAQIAVGTVLPVHDVIDAFQTGAGIPFEKYSPDLHEGQARMNRAAFLRRLGTEWIPHLPDVDDRLDAGGRVADVGCGFGYSCVGIATAYPEATVDGYDLDAESVTAARETVLEAGVADRVTVHHRDIADPEIEGDYDLVTALECVHDMVDPVGALESMRRIAGDGGVVLVMDERTGQSFADRTEIESILYGFSVLHCLPVGLVDRPSAATGTVMRADTLREYATAAGFDSVTVLDIEDFFFRFYRLDP